jgi:hypothetical protein
MQLYHEALSSLVGLQAIDGMVALEFNSHILHFVPYFLNTILTCISAT